MGHRPLDRSLMLEALQALDAAIDQPSHLVIGGGGAMVLAYRHPLATQDIDAFTAAGSVRLAELDCHAKRIAAELDIEPDWLNSHFETFTGVLPQDYGSRLRLVFEGNLLRADALGPEDVLLMKCFAGRDKDISHARALLRFVRDLTVVDDQLALLAERGYPGALRAADFFDDLRDREGV